MKEYKKHIAEIRKRCNYLIDGEDGEYTAIYFTGNVFAGEPDRAISRMQNNYFDFYKMRIKKASKHILLRDVAELYYSNGISEDIDSIDKILEFLKSQTKNSKIITIGLSAGGYAAVLFGCLLGAERIFSISGQFAASFNEEYDLPELMQKHENDIFYLCPVYSEMDSEQFELIKNIDNVKVLGLLSHVHHAPLPKEILNKIINSDSKLYEIFSYKKKHIKERTFILKHFGILSFFKRMVGKNLLKYGRSCMFSN